MRKKTAVGMAVALAGASLFSTGVFAAECDTCSKTESGEVKGVLNTDVVTFKGIPYADAPVGENRFMPPKPPKKWLGVRDASNFGAVCPQAADHIIPYPQKPKMLDLVGGPVHEIPVFANEDCLSLNIWKPHGSVAKLPVMLYVHGGAFFVGAGSSPAYDGTALARNGVLVVNFNYRLGLFGFAELGSLDSQYTGSGNNGFRDQIAALKWVKNNISAFGGDPENITIFGESAGGASVASMLVSPQTKGLFKRAIIQSGNFNLLQTPEAAKRTLEQLLAAGKLKSMKDFKSATTEELLQVQLTAQFTAQNSSSMFAPKVGTLEIPANPEEALKSGVAKEIPVIVGANQDEINYWNLYDSKFRNLFIDEWDGGQPNRLLPLDVEAKVANANSVASLEQAYAKAIPGASERARRVAMVNDFIMNGPAVRFAENHALGGGNTYLYRFAWTMPDKYVPQGTPQLGAVHAMEIPFVFGILDDRLKIVPGIENYYRSNESAVAKELSKKMSLAWSNFAKFGDPNGQNVPQWSQYTLSTRPTLVWNSNPILVKDFESERRKVWSAWSFGPYPYKI
ncbi:carboxylesterase family protein [Pseudomonas sp. RIT-To-2]|uniref:carboxylesterase family protein n=1 Tax=Pseudomonas sp. RIT-To-2 TaxID=3462541 RepID=UPI0024135820